MPPKVSKRKLSIPYSFYVLGALTALGVVLSIYRLAMGLEATTNLSDHYPWGLWIGLDVFLIPVAGAAFTVSAISHFWNREDYHRILRPAVFTGLLGYVSVAVILILDLGRWHQFYNILIPNYINLHSFLEEVALSVTLYTMILILEAAPTLLERWNLRLPIHFIERNILLIAGVGILISTVHQSSLGSMFLLVKHRLHPLWWTPILPLLFLLQALFGGVATAGVVVKLTLDKLGLPLDAGLFRKINKLVSILLALYLILRLGDLAVTGELGLLFGAGGYSLLAWGDLLIGCAIPLLILLSRFGKRAEGVFWAGIWIVLGIFINRVTISWIGLSAPPWATYVPHPVEVLSSLGILAGAVLAYLIVARFFNLFPEIEHAHHQ
ncbi:MAG: polysulfide reductase NrfD [Anaerolineae bacterium]|nr:polysulfide reductase NrfD [Anaerolineae bacterium]